MTDHLLDVRGLRKTFNLHARGKSLAVLDDVDVSVAPASIQVLSGPSGAGKSTILKHYLQKYKTNNVCMGRHDTHEGDMK